MILGSRWPYSQLSSVEGPSVKLSSGFQLNEAKIDADNRRGAFGCRLWNSSTNSWALAIFSSGDAARVQTPLEKLQSVLILFLTSSEVIH